MCPHTGDISPFPRLPGTWKCSCTWKGVTEVAEQQGRGQASPTSLASCWLPHKPCALPRLCKTQTELQHFCSLKSPPRSGAADGAAQITECTKTDRRKENQRLWKHSPTHIPGEREHCSYLQISQELSWHKYTSLSRTDHPPMAQRKIRVRADRFCLGHHSQTKPIRESWPGPGRNHALEERYLPFFYLVVDQESSENSIFQHTES